MITQPPPGIHGTNPLNEETPRPNSQIKELHIDVKKRAPFTFITDSNSSIMSVINCNNCTKYVRDQKVSMYYGAYTTKHSTDCEKALAEAMLAIEKHENKVRKQQQQADNENERYQQEREMEEDNMEEPQLPTPRRSDYSIGLGKLLSAVRASTNGDTIGGPLAAFALLGNNIFAMSHQTAPLPLTQAIGYLEKQNINATFTRFGEVKATIHDYVFRSNRNQDIEDMNYWTFIKTQESCKLAPQKRRDSDNDNDDELEPEPTREIHRFSSSHPQHATQGHRARTNVHWTKYLAKRLPDQDDLEDNSNLTTEEREQRREEYAKGVLIMFLPFREKTDLVNEDETWWIAYQRQKQILYSNQDTKTTIDSIQNFYESFCRPSSESQALDFTEKDLQQMAEEENETIDTNEEEIDIIDIDQEIEKTADEPLEELTKDPFIAKLASLPENPMDIPTRQWTSTINRNDALQAIRQLPSKSGNKFTLPGRASLGFPISESNPTTEDAENDTQLDRPLGKNSYHNLIIPTNFDFLLLFSRNANTTTGGLS